MAKTEPELVYEDDDVLVVDKPAGLVVHPAPSHKGETLVDWLGERSGGGESDRPGIVHRLDKGTSGLMVVARNERALRGLADQLRDRTMKRDYTALVEGTVDGGGGKIEAPIGRDRRRRTRMSIGGVAAREAVTNFEVVERHPASTLIEAHLETGRTHQVRVHLSAIGHPVVADPEYGTAGMLGLDRQFLHAKGLTFTHPGTGEAMSFTSPLPEDLDRALGMARSGQQT